MTIEAFATLLGRNVVLTTPEGVAQGMLQGVQKLGDDGALFKLGVLGTEVRVPVVDGEEWELNLAEWQPAPPPTDDTFQSPWNGDGTGIMIEPTNWAPEVKWALYIPPTQEDHLNSEGVPIEPWGTTYWSSLTAVLACLSLARKNGSIVFADGRTAE